MPNLSGPNPLSPGEFQAYAAGSGYPAAVGGLSSLAGAMIGDPSRIAQAGYLGAQTGHAQAETEKINRTLRDKSEVASLLSDPANFQNPKVVSRIGALLAGNEELAKSVPVAINMLTQIAAQRGADAGARAVADRLSGGLGIGTGYAGTASGLGEEIAGRRAVAETQAGATRYTADTQLTGKREELASAAARDIGPVVENGQVVYRPKVASGQGGAAYYDPELAKMRATRMPYQNEEGRTEYLTAEDAAKRGLQARPHDKAELEAAMQQNTVSPPRPSPLVGTLAGTGPGVGQGTSGASAAPGMGGAIGNNVLANVSGQPAAKTTSIEEAEALREQITTRLKALHPTSFRENTPTEGLLGPIQAKAAWLYDHDPSARGNWAAAIDKAVTMTVGAGGEGIDAQLGYFGPFKRPAGLIPKEGYQGAWPEGMPVPDAYRGQGAAPSPSGAQPAAAPAPVESASTGSPSGAPRPGGPSVASVVSGTDASSGGTPVAPVTQRALESIPNPAMRDKAVQALTRAGVPPSAWPGFISIVHNESGWNPNAPNGAAGEIGPVQIKPATAAMVGIDPKSLTDLDTNLLAGALYYKNRLAAGGGDVTRALRGYNTGSVNGGPTPYTDAANRRLFAWGGAGPVAAAIAPPPGFPRPMGAAPPQMAQAAPPAAAPPPAFASILPLIAQANATQAAPQMPQAAPVPVQAPQIAQPGLPNAPQPAAQPPPPLEANPQMMQQAVARAQSNPAQALNDARQVIVRNPAARPAVIARLRAAGIQVPPDILTGR